MQGQPAGRIIKLVMAGEVEFDVTLTAVQPWNLEYTPISREPYNQSLVLQGTAAKPDCPYSQRQPCRATVFRRRDVSHA